MTRRLTPGELAHETGLEPAVVDRVIATGALHPDREGRLAASDAAVATTVADLLAAGIDEQDLAWLTRERGLRFDVIAELFPEADPSAGPGTRTADAPTAPDPQLDRLAVALGLPERDEATGRPAAEEAMVAELRDAWIGVDPSGDAAVRAARSARDATAHLVETWLDTWDARARPSIFTQGAPAADGADGRVAVANPTPAMGDLARRLVVRLLDRSLHDALTARIIEGVEHELAAAGRLPARPVWPEAVAFVDLSGFTTHAVQAGDLAALAAAERLREIVERCVGRSRGRVVKRLGDGALLLFPDPASAVATTLAIVGDPALDPTLPVHAAVAAGRVVRHEGDVFGTTVNLAARLLSSAGPGEVLVEEGVVVALPRGTATFEPVGRLELRSFPVPVAVWRALPPT
jgi:adenylate cyclase